MKKLLTRTALLFLLLLGIGMYMAYTNAPYLIIKPRRVQYHRSPQQMGMEAKDVVWTTTDGLRLKGWATFPPDGAGKPVVVFLHGIGNSKETWTDEAKKFYERGMACIAFDGRAHGESEGEYCTFGFLEKKDVAVVADWAETHFPGRPIGVYGNSLGGAVALQALEFDPDLDFGIVTSTFADLESVVEDYQERYFMGYRNERLAHAALAEAAIIADFDPMQVKPAESAKHIHQPIFYAHGTQDKNIDVEYGKRIFKNLASEDKKLYLVEGATHYDVWRRGGAGFEAALMNFLEKQKN